MISKISARKVSTVGFIGLGQMGFPMSLNLLKKSAFDEFVIFDVSKESIERFRKEIKGTGKQVKVVSTPMELAKLSSTIITMLPASKHVLDVYSGEFGIFKGLKKNALLIDSSTIDPKTSKDIAKIAKELQAIALDAPVSGGTNGALSGTLTFMVGCESETIFDKTTPILSHMGKNIVYCGSNGNGQVAKIVNNMLLGISMIAASEAMSLGVKLGIEPKLLASIINTSSGRSWSTDTYNPCPGVMPNAPASKDYEGGFGNALMTKDLGLAVSAAIDSKATVILGATALQVYQQVSSTSGYERKDFSSVYKWLNDR